MPTTMNNLEKLFQIAAMEQMFELMQKMKKDINYDSSVLNFTKNDALNTDELKKDKLIIDTKYDNLYIQIQDLKMLVNNLTLKNQTYCDNINQLTLKVKILETELSQIKTDKEHNNQYICAQVRGQQLLTSYPGFSKEPSNSKVDENENIKLKIEERQILVEEPDPTIEVVVDTSDAASDDNSVSEDEVGTDDDEPLEIKEQVEEQEVVEEQEEVVEEQDVEEDEEEDVEEDEEEEKEEDEDEEEEVFEIEIDDVTYFATDEENGILYEVTKDGEVGKKVGIIKDSEPIFT
jgi:hypothetical protein